MELSKQQQRIFTVLKEGTAALKAAQAEVGVVGVRVNAARGKVAFPARRPCIKLA
jgi:hypothetical protein